MATSLMQTAEDLAKKNEVTPVTVDYDESKGVAGRVNSLVSQDSPLMQLAATRAKQSANARGLRNSSMAVGAGQRAIMETATPIASADAQLFQNQSLTNQNARNQGNQFNATNALTAGMRGMELGENARQFDAGQMLTREMFSSDDAFRKAQLKQQESEFSRSFGENARQFDAGQKLTRDMFSSDDAFRRAQLAQQESEFGRTYGLNQTAMQQAQQQIDNQMTQFAAQLGLSKDQLQLQRDSLSQEQKQFLAQLEQQQAQLNEQSRQFDASRQDNLAMFDKELAQNAEQFGLTQEQTLALANMDVDTKLKMADIEAKYKNEIQGSQNISQAWGTMMQQVGNIQNNPDLDAKAKTTLIENNLASFASFSNFWSASSGVDVSDLLALEVADVPAGSGDKDSSPGGSPKYDGYSPDGA